MRVLEHVHRECQRRVVRPDSVLQRRHIRSLPVGQPTRAELTVGRVVRHIYGVHGLESGVLETEVLHRYPGAED